MYKTLKEEWKQNIKDMRNPEKFYHEILIDKEYEQFAAKRNIQRFWHQARLETGGNTNKQLLKQNKM